jgi:nickel superoxide dismutase
MRNIKIILTNTSALLILLLATPKIYAHCEIPCGIYGDSTQITLLYEHIATIEKSMNEINELSKATEINYNQLVRWINNKEEHAQKIQEIVSQYFLHQRIKIKENTDETAYKKYIEQLTLLHQLSVYAMKSKQTTDTTYSDKLRDTLHQFEHAYFD